MIKREFDGDLRHSMNVGDLISIKQPVRVPLKWWQRPFAQWIEPRYEMRDVFYRVKAVSKNTAQMTKENAPE